MMALFGAEINFLIFLFYIISTLADCCTLHKFYCKPEINANNRRLNFTLKERIYEELELYA